VNLRFDQPGLLLLGLLVVPMIGLGWRCLRTMDRLRRVTVLLLRSAVLLALVTMLAGPRTVREHHDLTVIGVLDLSGSVRRFAQLPEIPDLERRSNVEFLRRWFRLATRTKASDDRFGLIVFDGTATVISVPVKGEYVDDNLDVEVLPGTNIADAIRLALAMFPADVGKRIVLVSDGNETTGDAIEAAREAAAGFLAGRDDVRVRRTAVPIDVAPITYTISGDVQVVRVESPPTAQAGQTVTVRIVLAATEAARGRLVLRREGEPVDLNGARPGTSRPVEIPTGQSVHLAQVVLGDTPVNRFEAIFEPQDPGRDVLLDNNRAEAFTATPSRGMVLVLDRRGEQRPNVLARTLERADIPTEVQPPHLLGDDLLSMQKYDLIVLDNVAAYELTPPQHQLLGRYVHDLGGGLIMVGGEESFGAGGWNGTDLAPLMPVELDPPKELRLASAALVLVLDKSGSMNRHVAGTRTTQQRIANEAAAMAIESLRRESLVGVVTFDFFAHEHVPLQRNDDPERIAQQVRGITSDGGTNLAPALRAAYRMLANVEAQKKLVVCLSDGQSQTRNLDDIVDAMSRADIKLSTIAVGDDADYETLRRLAQLGDGEFYPVRNPRTLPRYLVDSVQIINKPLIKEVPFVPVVLPTGSTLTMGMESAPVLDGLVITAPRPDPKATVEMSHPEGEPLLAHWQVGLGRVAAFTSDSDGRWSRRWIEWPGYAKFWTQLVRTITRPSTSPDTELVTQITEDRLLITLEAAPGGDGRIDYLHVDGVVYTPDGEATPIRLRQTAPGQYETSVAAAAPGNYIVALSPRRGSRRLAPVIGGMSQSASPEFRRFRSNVALLEEIAQITGGRALDITRPAAADLFDRSELPASLSALPAWQTILWLALGLVLLDVASRRLAWDSGLLRRLLAQALARVGAGRVRGREAAATLATLRRVSGQLDKQLEARSAEAGRQIAERARGQGKRPPPAAAGAPPEPSKVSAALNALLGKSTPPPARPPQPPPPADEAGSTPTTSSLLAAKRRARRRLGEEDEERD
jgi:uncharacterized protein YegL